MAVFDATTLLYLLEPDAKAPLDPATNNSVADARQRIELLIETLEARRETVVIPTPVLSEVLVHAGAAGPRYLQILDRTRCFRIEPFDRRAAIELAEITRDAIRGGGLRAGTDATRAKLKFDRQIIAIARAAGESTIYSDDADIAKLGGALGLSTVPVYRLPRPSGAQQRSLDLEFDDTG